MAISYLIWLVVWTPLKKYESQLGWLFPTYGEIKNVPNHQPVIIPLSYSMKISPSVLQFNRLNIARCFFDDWASKKVGDTQQNDDDPKQDIKIIKISPYLHADGVLSLQAFWNGIFGQILWKLTVKHARKPCPQLLRHLHLDHLAYGNNKLSIMFDNVVNKLSIMVNISSIIISHLMSHTTWSKTVSHCGSVHNPKESSWIS